MALIRAELTIHCGHRPGELAKILELAAEQGINVLAFTGHAHDGGATLMIVPDDAQKAASALKQAGIAFDSNPVLVVKGASGVGGGAQIARKLADAGVNLEYTYASTSGIGESVVVFKVEKLDEAAKLLE